MAPPRNQTNGDPGGWSVQSIGKRWQFRFFHMLILIGGLRPAYHIMYVVVLWYVLFVPSIRRRTQPYLSRRFPHHRGRLRQFWDSYRLVVTFARTMIDRAAHALLGERVIGADCPDVDNLRRVFNRGEGALLLNAHIGCWQVAMSSISHVNRPVSFVMIPPGGDTPAAELTEEKLPFEIIDPRRGAEGVVEMLAALQSGKILGMMGDRVFGRTEETVKAEFLGSQIELPFAPYRLAAVTGRPITVLFSHKTQINRYRLRLATVIRVPSHVRNPEDAVPYARQFTDALESYVEACPWQFFNFYDMWNDPLCHAQVLETGRENEV